MTGFQKLLLKRMLLQAVAFPAHPLYPVAVNGFFKIPATHAKACLQCCSPVKVAWRKRFEIYLEGIQEKMLSFPEQLLYPLTAFEPFRFSKCIFLFQDLTKIALNRAIHYQTNNHCDTRVLQPYIIQLFCFLLVRNSQFLTAFFTTACQHFTPVGSLHAFTKTMNSFAATFVRLKCTFHCIMLFSFLK